MVGHYPWPFNSQTIVVLPERELFILSLLLFLLVLYLYGRSRGKRRSRTAVETSDRLTAVEGDVSRLPVLQHRPYKPVYHLSMHIKACQANNIFVMDVDYVKRMQYRKDLLQRDPTGVIGFLPRSEAALQELYRWIAATWLPTCWPLQFVKTGSRVENRILGVSLPSQAPSISQTILETLFTQAIEEDLLLLLPIDDPSHPRNGKYQLVAYCASGPTGFAWSDKLGKSLADIHGPVPGYSVRLEKSMDRYFERLEVDKSVQRLNWNVAPHSELYSPYSNHLKPEQLAEEADESIVADSVLRVERQTLSRLPRTGAILFTVKTYMYRLQDLKQEGAGPALIEAIDGLPEDMAHYKSRPTWGKVVKEYLAQ